MTKKDLFTQMAKDYKKYAKNFDHKSFQEMETAALTDLQGNTKKSRPHPCSS